jgi:cytochrome c-type biogenesis protein CcmF
MEISDLLGIFGYLGLTSAFIICISIIIIALIAQFFKAPALERFASWLTHAQTILLAVACISLGVLLQIGAYEYEIVFNAVENTMSSFERIGGLWSSQAASLLFWSLIMSTAASLSLFIAKRIPTANHAMTVLFILEITLVFFILPDVFFSNPFLKTWIMNSGSISTAVFPPEGASLLVPIDGQGMNPSLRHIAMFFHPPTLYLGLIGFFIPYAFALSSLVHKDRDNTWMRLVFPIVLFAWVFLTIGMFLGSWWAYTILGWGGYWGWDAVEISGLLPWLLSFGLVHSFNMQIRGKPFKKWLYPLSFAIVILTLFGILITRSGILESVHAYTSGAMGPVLTILVLLHVLTAAVLLILRCTLISETSSEKRSVSFSDKLTRLFNICLVVLVLIYLFGQTLPLTSQLFLSEKLSFTPQNYEQYSAPVLLLVVVLTALFPIASQKEADLKAFNRTIIILIVISIAVPLVLLIRYTLSTTAFIGFWAASFLLCSWLRALIQSVILPIFLKKNGKTNHSRRMGLGSILIHLGFAVMALGILGVENLSVSHDMHLNEGSTLEISGHTITNLSQEIYQSKDGSLRFENKFKLTPPNGPPYELVPIIKHFPKLNSLHAQPAIAAGFLQDVQILMSEIPDSQENTSDARIAFFPLMSWIWAGGAIMSVGGLLALFVRKR